MANQPPKTTRRRKPAPASGRGRHSAVAALAAPDLRSTILQRVHELVAANAALRSNNAKQRVEIDQLKTVLRQIDRSLRGAPAAPAAARPRRRAALKSGPPSERKNRTQRMRAVITDPAVLEKRRAALVKARKALAAKRAAAKAS